MSYQKIFDLKKSKALQSYLATQPARARLKGDRRDGLVYLYDEQIELRINVALATGRPLLLRGPSGSGKSSLARNVAIRLGRRYYEQVISSSTQHTDLLWSYDALKRFHDAQAKVESAALLEDEDYIEPRVLWWAFDRESALRRGLPKGRAPAVEARDPSPTAGDDAVVLVDEIDKADPDVPNNLLVAIGSLEFSVPYLKAKQNPIRARASPLVMITSNDERELPGAFLRRCVTLNLKVPDAQRMVEIAAEHHGDSVVKRRLYARVADVMVGEPTAPGARCASTAEYLDAVGACLRMKVRPAEADPVWQGIREATLLKPPISSDGDTKA